MKNYKDDPKLLKLATSLIGSRITEATIIEDYNYAALELSIRKGGVDRIIEIGASGNLYDEAYFVFEEIK